MNIFKWLYSVSVGHVVTSLGFNLTEENVFKCIFNIRHFTWDLMSSSLCRPKCQMIKYSKINNHLFRTYREKSKLLKSINDYFMKPSALKVSRMCLPEAGEYIPEEWSLHTSPGLSTSFVSTHNKTLLNTGYRTDENIVWTSVAFVNTPSFSKIVTMI